ncbi:hypothetical protein [Paraburkholderia silviterrae]|uniref:hypothetical protein n=1 Tax=Paraburkholderia silviterrae TaxID=2528715 RepID=UPI00269D9C43
MSAEKHCCANCACAVKLDNAIGSACRFARSFPLGRWREWLDEPFTENECDRFDALSANEIARRQRIRADLSR